MPYPSTPTVDGSKRENPSVARIADVAMTSATIAIASSAYGGRASRQLFASASLP
jgi:hypothetical protein